MFHACVVKFDVTKNLEKFLSEQEIFKSFWFLESISEPGPALHLHNTGAQWRPGRWLGP
jgi:hypothetical protein